MDTTDDNFDNLYMRDKIEKYSIFLPNVVVECLTLLRIIQEVSSSNLGPETGYPD
jgi:hypothetical protein